MATSKTPPAPTSANNPAPLSIDEIAQRIQLIRGQRVLLDADLAALYGVDTRRLNEQVRRNRDRFPADFIFEVTTDEFANLMSQFATSSLAGSANKHGGRRKLPLAFTEHGAIMAATILSSPRAVAMSVHVVRSFVQLKSLVATHQDFAKRLASMEAKHDSFSRQTQRDLKEVFDTLRELMTPPTEPTPPKRQIGFITDDAPLPKLKPKAFKGKALKS